eukprot:122590-Amphidinium_carterae.1
MLVFDKQYLNQFTQTSSDIAEKRNFRTTLKSEIQHCIYRHNENANSGTIAVTVSLRTVTQHQTNKENRVPEQKETQWRTWGALSAAFIFSNQMENGCAEARQISKGKCTPRQHEVLMHQKLIG